MSTDDVKQLIFGTFDGLTSAVGLVVALALVHPHEVVAAATALAVGAAASMGAGEWLADDAADSKDKTRRATLMGLATLFGSAAPAVPFLITSGAAALAGCGLVTVAVGCAIAELRPGARPPSYARTFVVLTVATALAVAASLVTS